MKKYIQFQAIKTAKKIAEDRLRSFKRISKNGSVIRPIKFRSIEMAKKSATMRLTSFTRIIKNRDN